MTTQSMFSLYIVEDHAVMREVYTRYLETAGPFRICGTADRGETALTEIPDLNPDAVLVDISLPGMSGLTLVEQLHAAWPNLPAIVISGHDDTQYRKAALKAGAREFVTKGSAELVLHALTKLLGRSLSS